MRRPDIPPGRVPGDEDACGCGRGTRVEFFVEIGVGDGRHTAHGETFEESGRKRQFEAWHRHGEEGKGNGEAD